MGLPHCDGPIPKDTGSGALFELCLAQIPRVRLNVRRPSNQLEPTHLVLKEEVSQSEAILFDGVYEMMNMAAYIHFAGKAKNGSIDPDEARVKWEQEFLKPGAVTDMLGPTPKLARRVAIKVKDLVTHRDATEKNEDLR